MYCAKKAALACEQLPPCLSALWQHIQRANYQSKIWRSSLLARFAKFLVLRLKWMDCNPAPDEVMELVVCNCKKKCDEKSCTCMQLGFFCTDACFLANCKNRSGDGVSMINDDLTEHISRDDSDQDSDLENPSSSTSLSM